MNNTNAKYRWTSTQGLTAPELLWVVVIFLLLIVILVPVITVARDAPGFSSCALAGRSMETSMRMYLLDHDNQYPADYDFWSMQEPHVRTGVHSFAQDIAPYEGKFVRCPLTSENPEIPKYLTHGFAINDHLSERTREAKGQRHRGIKASRLGNPEQTILFAEARSGLISLFAPDFSWLSSTFGNPPDDIASIAHTEPGGASRHIGRANYIYCDGHAKSISAKAFFERESHFHGFLW